MKFLYWNINKKPIQNLITALAQEHDIDVIILSECDFRISDLLTEINKTVEQKYGLPINPITKPEPLIISRLPLNSLISFRDILGASFRRLLPPIGIDILLIAVHFPSKMFLSDEDQASLTPRLSREIENAENEIGHRRTIIVGDLNMNPFESGVVGSEGLHAVMTRKIAEKNSRLVKGEEKFFFYNPMWCHFGDFPEKHAGTYFYDKGSPINFYWNIFDQVLIRPELLNYFRNKDLRIITKIGSTNLLDSTEKPNIKIGSDHLPIIFNLDLEKGV